MKLLFLGTGAADWKLAAPETDGYRRFSSALVDGCLLIDPGPDVPEALDTFGVAPEQIRYIINTHDHSDHYNADTLALLTAAGAQFVPFAAGEKKTVGGYTVEAVRAHHGTCAGAVHFLISDGEKTLFYGLDGAWLMYEEFTAIGNAGKVDLFVLDATIGDVPGDYRIFEHNNLHMVEEMRQTLLKYGSRFAISHMAYTLHTDHTALAERMRGSDIEVAYDGWETEL